MSVVRMRADLTVALKARDRVAMAALRSALAAVDNAQAVRPEQPTDGGAENAHIAGSVTGIGAAEAQRKQLTETDIQSIIEHEVRERSATAADYERHGQRDLAEQLRAEAEVLRRYLG